MLIDDFKVGCKVMNKTIVPDGQGGYKTVWTEGTAFDAAIVTEASTEQRQAEKVIGEATYQVTIPKTLSFAVNDVFKRVSDGQIFRVTSTSDDVKTPAKASFSFSQVTAERWVLPS